MKLKKGDSVIVVSGKDKGKSGKIARALPVVEQVIIEGVNTKTRHVKTNKQTKQGGGIITMNAPIHVSNVMLLDPKDNKPTRVGKTFDETKKKWVRVAKRSGTTLS